VRVDADAPVSDYLASVLEAGYARPENGSLLEPRYSGLVRAARSWRRTAGITPARAMAMCGYLLAPRPLAVAVEEAGLVTGALPRAEVVAAIRGRALGLPWWPDGAPSWWRAVESGSGDSVGRGTRDVLLVVCGEELDRIGLLGIVARSHNAPLWQVGPCRRLSQWLAAQFGHTAIAEEVAASMAIAASRRWARQGRDDPDPAVLPF
jgi:hypothetical protein